MLSWQATRRRVRRLGLLTVQELTAGVIVCKEGATRPSPKALRQADIFRCS